MSFLKDLLRRLHMLRRGEQFDRDLDDEMRAHLERREERLRAKGLSGEDAHRAARLQFGNSLRLREESQDAWGWRWLEQLLQDLRFGVRTLLRAPGFTLTVVLMLALGIGATTAIFSIVSGVLLRPLPFAKPGELVQVYGVAPLSDRYGISFADLTEFRRQTTTVAKFMSYSPTTRRLQTGSTSARLTAVMADRDFFDLLGVVPMLGRTFQSDDSEDVAVLGADAWRRHFSADPSVIGRTVILDGRPFTLIGVMPDQFQFPYSSASVLAGSRSEARSDVWVPDGPPNPRPETRRGRLTVTARLKPGISIDRAAAEMSAINDRLVQMFPDSVEGRRVRLVPLDDVVVPAAAHRSLWILFGAVGLVLVAACANVANLILTRTSRRAREVAVRAALGAGRVRLIRQFFAESLLLSAAGGLVGIFVARWGTNLLVRLGSEMMPRAHEIAVDWRMLIFLLVVCLGVAIAFSLVAALSGTREDIQTITKESGGTSTMSGRSRRMRDGFVAAEVGLAFVLAVGAAILTREMIRISRVDPGVATDRVLTMHLTLRNTDRNFYEIEQRVAAVPGVEGAGLVQMLPLQNWGWDATFSVKSRPPEPLASRPRAELRYVTSGYFPAMGVPIVRGRGFLPTDTTSQPLVIIVNEALAKRYFPNEDPVGQVTDRGVIVGVIADIRQANLDVPAVPEIYYHVPQNVAIASDLGMSLVVRTAGPPETVLAAVRSAVHDVSPAIALFNVRTMKQVVSESLWQLDLYRWLFGLFAGLALVIAGVGLFGAISYSAAARTREFAIRLALGSDERALARLVLSRGLRLAAAGLAAGVATAGVLVVLLKQLPGIFRPDVLTVVIVAAVLVAISLIASALPALRVTRVSAVTALRQE